MPGCVARFAYGGFAADADAGDLRPLPTCLGHVDARRLFVVTCGQGSGAKNAVFSRRDRSDDSCPGTVAHPPYWVLGAARDGCWACLRGAAAAGATAARAAADALVEFAARPANPPRAFPARFAEEPPGDVELV